jgi:hypothetical protein
MAKIARATLVDDFTRRTGRRKAGNSAAKD